MLGNNKFLFRVLLAAAIGGVAVPAGARPDVGDARPHLVGAADLVVARMAPQILAETARTEVAALVVTPPPAPSRSGSVRASSYNVFRSVVVPVGKIPARGKWQAASSGLATNIEALCAGQFCATRTGKRLAAAARQAAGEDSVAALSTINSAVNRTLAYRSDRGDHWATPLQIAQRGAGDCEDFAIAKYALLRAIGFPAEQLQLVVLKDTRKQLFHAVLTVHVDGRRYVLDNLQASVVSDAALRNYVPIMSFVGPKSYIHGFKEKRPEVAGLDLATVQPGE